MRSQIAAAALLLAACDGATAPHWFRSSVDDSRLPVALRAAYAEDAARLALRDLLRQGFTGIPIPTDASQPYYDALVLVYNAPLMPARDTVVDIYRIHTMGNPATRSLYLVAPPDQPWAQRLAHDSLPTGNATIDRLLSAYALSYDHAFIFTDELLIVLRSADPLNMQALAPQFAQVAGVQAGPNGVVGEGNDISGSRGDVIHLDYSVGYGDCPSGCISRRVYHFAIRTDTVEYLGATGSPPPRPGRP